MPFDKETQMISLSQMVSVVCSDVSELLGGVLETEEIKKLNAYLFEEAIVNTRTQKETDFIYYQFR